MRYQGERQSTNVEDRRGRGMRRAGALGGGGLVLVLLAMLFGVDPSRLLDGVGGGPAAAGEGPVQTTPEEEQLKEFISVVLASTEDVWNQVLPREGVRYREPVLTLFRDVVHTACGTQQSQVGPFYCPGDQHVYLDMDFFEVMQRRLGAPGDFAQAYVIAHEVGHHVQNLLGYADKVHQLHGRVSQEEYNRWSVRLELQADFLAGVWAHHAQRLRSILEQGDIEEAMNAAAAVGDDKLQREAGRAVRPESFTHGPSEQRRRAFELGLKTGDLRKAADFFAAGGGF
jgi:predicted metalloprotease